MIRVELHALRRSKWWEHAIRFVFGGLVTVVAGLIGKKLGATIGGLFLAFPSILPASLAMLASHSGRDKARSDARGAAAGSLALLGFAAVVFFFSSRWSPALVLLVAFASWLVLSVVLWAALVSREGEDPGLPHRPARSD